MSDDVNNNDDDDIMMIQRIEISAITEFDSYVKKNVDPKFLNSFTTVHTFNETDQVF